MYIIDALVPTNTVSRRQVASTILPFAPTELDPALRGRARGMRQRLEESPEATGQQAAEDLAKGVVSCVTGAVDAVNAELGAVTRAGLVFASARPGLKRIALVLTDRLAPKRRHESFLTTKPNDGALVLTVERLGTITELAHVDLKDANAAATLRAAAEEYVLETAEKFAQGAA